MKISIFGMGYVGVVSAACLLRDGHEILGIDPVGAKVADLGRGCSPVQEPGVAELLTAGHRAGRLRATTDPQESLTGSDMAWICVGTPCASDGGIDLAAVETVVRQIGRTLRGGAERPSIVLRSTCLPGTTNERIIPLLERESGLTAGREIDLVFHPEFLREGTGVEDFLNPPKTVVGEDRPGAADRLLALYHGCGAPVFRLSIAAAEMVKYWDNLFHALKITFANEMGAVAKSAGLDARRVAEVFCADTRLNISPKYLRPGPAFGGSCLPKDLRALLRLAALKSVRLPMLERVLESNEGQIEQIVRRILAHQPKMVGMVGLAFKTGTDDMRESPYVRIAKALIGEGVKLRIHDPVVQPQRLIGSNKEQVQQALRHLEELLVGSLDDLAGADLILLNHPTVAAQRVLDWTRAGIRVLDTVGIAGLDPQTPRYEGLYW
ncbi:MAG: UDP-glucose/GDP-mannose dehydrogenase family protein [Planctomycetes bacterium]|nr:UDP-glucose/GDP-mannose dehydrogenase family protein [Planctomycetota bacterium]